METSGASAMMNDNVILSHPTGSSRRFRVSTRNIPVCLEARKNTSCGGPATARNNTGPMAKIDCVKHGVITPVTGRRQRDSIASCYQSPL
eukprot:32909-Eustigmatos_ZCMA.PRE.1